MKRSDFGDLMKTREAWASSEVPEGCWPIVRVDGRGFSGLTEARYRKPFDEEFAVRMRLTAVALLGELGGVVGYTQSDEISIVLPPDWSMFNRRAEKAASVGGGDGVGVVLVCRSGRSCRSTARCPANACGSRTRSTATGWPWKVIHSIQTSDDGAAPVLWGLFRVSGPLATDLMLVVMDGQESPVQVVAVRFVLD